MVIKTRAKRFAVIVLIVIILLSALSLITGRSLVLPIFEANKTPRVNIKGKPGDNIDVFSNFDFTKDDWKAYLLISSDDFADLHPLIKKRSCLKTTDRRLLDQMKKTWKFKITEGDIATVGSELVLFKNGKLVFKTGIVLDKNAQRLQNEEYGEMIPVNNLGVINSCKQFKRVYWPVVFL